jgi:hypothetical protein
MRDFVSRDSEKSRNTSARTASQATFEPGHPIFDIIFLRFVSDDLRI